MHIYYNPSTRNIGIVYADGTWHYALLGVNSHLHYIATQTTSFCEAPYQRTLGEVLYKGKRAKRLLRKVLRYSEVRYGHC